MTSPLIIPIEPMGAVRLPNRMKYSPKGIRYKKWKQDFLILWNNLNGWRFIQGGHVGYIKFVLPMPYSWSAKKKNQMNGKPHQTRPDTDNLLKSLLDSIASEDSYIWKFDGMEKIYGKLGGIIVYPPKASKASEQLVSV